MTAAEQPRFQTSRKLLKVRSSLVQLGHLVGENLSLARQATIGDQLDLIPEVIAADNEIDKRYDKLDQSTFMAIAQRQPTDADLRFLVSSSRLAYELERSGDLVVNVVHATKQIKGLPESPTLRDYLRRLFAECGRILERSMDVFDRLDAADGARLDKEDDVVDDLVAEFYAAIKVESDTIGLEAGIALNRIGRFLERIADHAVNVGNNTAFIVTGEFPRHTGSSAAEDE